MNTDLNDADIDNKIEPKSGDNAENISVNVENNDKEIVCESKCPSEKIGKERRSRKSKKPNLWPLKITIITFLLSLFFSFISEITTKRSNVVIAGLLLVLLILISIIFDGIGVSVTSCDLAPLNAMAAKKVPHAKVAIKLVKNAEKVNNICADVIGDFCGIVSGACGSALVVKIIEMTRSDSHQFIIAILVSAFIAAMTVGGKAFEKAIAIKNSQEFVMFTARIIGIFYHPDKKRKNKNVRKSK